MQLKKKTKFLFETYKQSINNQKFVLIFLLLFIMTLYGIFGLSNSFQKTPDYISGFLRIILNNNYAAFLLLVVVFNTVNIYDIFSKNYNYIIRLDCYEKFLICLIENIIFSNIMLLIVNFLLVMIGLNIFNPIVWEVNYNYYNLLGIIYLIYAILRFTILANVISVFYILISKIANNSIAIMIITLICSSIMFVSFDGGLIISSLKTMPILIGYYFVSIRYSSFLFEVIICSLFISMLVLILIMLFKKASNSMRSVSK